MIKNAPLIFNDGYQAFNEHSADKLVVAHIF